MLELDFGTPSPKAVEYSGFVYDLDDRLYREAEGVSQSGIKTLVGKKPWEFFRKIQKPQTEAMIEGTLMHLLFSEPHKLEERFFITENPRDAKRGIFSEEIGDRIIYKRDDYLRLLECVNFVKEKMIERYEIDLDKMDGEVSFFGEYRGRKAKARADKITKDRKAVIDFKKTRSADPTDFIKHACDLKYGIQEVFYTELMGLDAFWFLAVETTPEKVDGQNHYLFTLFKSSGAMKEIAQREIDLAYRMMEKPEIFSQVGYRDEFIEDSLSDGIWKVRELIPPLWRMKQ